MRRFRTTIVLALATLLSISICSAQQAATTSVPNLIRYSGTLKDAQGAALSSSTAVGVTFSIYKQQDGGASVWMETQNVTPDSNGQYNVILGSTTATGLPDDLFLQQEQRWLGVQVQGEAEQGRVLLVSVPYAFKAHEAETLGGLPASAFVKAPPSDGSGSGSTGSNNGTSVNALGNVGNAGKASKGKGADGKGPLAICTPVPGRIILWDKDGSECPSNLFQVIDPLSPYLGNIGIGLTNPSKQLDVNFNVNARQWYDIGFPETRIVAVHRDPTINPAPSNSTNLFLGWSAGGPNGPQPNGALNTFTGFSAGFTNGAASSVANTYNGTYAGFTNLRGNANTMVGANAGFANIDSFNTCVGSSACQNHRNGGGGTYVGNAAGLGDVLGTRNSFFGDASGFGNVGNFNTFLGDRAGFNNRGNNNTFSGYQAGFNNTANGNSFYGYQAGLANLGGTQNAFFGNDAGLSNIGGNANTFSGNGAGFFHINGDQNTFSGTSAGFNDYHGKANTCIGASACQDNDVGPGHVSGNFNTYVGVSAGQNAFGSTNTFIGRGAGFGGPPGANNNGSFNTFSGNNAGANNTTGSYNTSYGYLAGVNNATGNSNVYLANFGANESNTIRIGMKGAGNQQQKIVFFDPILPNGTPTNYDAVTIEKNTGQLGHVAFPTSGGGNVVGPSPPCPAGFLPKWSGGLNVDCSVVYQQPGTNNIGIGTTNPSEALDVAGDISANPHGTPDRSSYQIGETTVLTAFGSGNTVVGFTNAHATNTGTNNTFVGAAAGTSNNTGARNTFVGSQAGQSNNGGFNNTFVGWLAGVNTNTGDSNTFVGLRAGQNNASGVGNSFYGRRAGTANVSGTYNLYLGTDSDENNAAGHNNIYLSNPGAPENNTIRIGGSTAISGFGPQTDTYVVGIYHSPPNPSNFYEAVCVDQDGKLISFGPFADCNRSSRRFKESILNMGDSSSKLFQLRPVTFFYKPQYDGGTHLQQYGLIAEEVAKVYPEMAVYDKDGQPYSVKYQLLAPMLLNELQKQHEVVAAQQDELQTQLQQIKTQQQQMQAQRHEIDGLKLQLQQQNASLQERLTKLESYVATQMKTASDNPPRTTPGANGGLQ